MTNHPSSPLCPDCGAPLPPDSPQALCPACLMRQALASRTMAASSDSTPPLPPPTAEEMAGKFPGYEIHECLGRGGMGVVYKAWQKSLDRWVAIKVLAPERVHDERFAEHFEREAKTLARMSHPNIVTVFDHGETSGLFYIVMEFVDGVNLRDLLREGKMEPEQALAIVPPICQALEYAHEKGVVHRDIKPENILLDREGRVKIADFGIAKLIQPVAPVSDPRALTVDEPQGPATVTFQAGTPNYAAPEQADGKADHRADIYALGVVLYEMLTGERPAKDLVAPSRKVQIDVRLDDVVLRALEKSPALRYQTAGEFRTVVETVASTPEGRGPQAIPASRNTAIESQLTPAHTHPAARFSHAAGVLTYLLAYAAFVLLLATTAGQLPPRVASHFGAEGHPNGWMGRSFYLGFVAAMPLLFGGVAMLVSWMTLRLPARFINIPRRDFWLAPERRPDTAAFLRRRMFWLAVLMTAFFAGLHLLTIQANQSTPARLSLDGLLAMVIVFLLAMMIWIVSLLMRLAEVEKPLAKPTPTVPPIASSVKRHPWPIWVVFGIHALMLVGLAGILLFTVPRFTAMTLDPGLELPVVTNVVIGVSKFTMGGGYLLVPLLIAVNFLLCWLAEKLGGRKLLAGWAVLGVIILLGLGSLVVGSIFLVTSRLVGSVAESEPGTNPTPAEFKWREVFAPTLVQTKWEPFGTGPTEYVVLTVDQPPITSPRYAIIGEIKYENVEGTAYLEMWSHFPESGRYFSRTLAPPGSGPMAVITGSSEWRPFTLPFDRSGTTDSLSKLEVNLYLPAKGKVYLRALRLVEDEATSALQPNRPVPLKPIPPEAARLFEELRKAHESQEFGDLLQNAPHNPDLIKRYNEEIHRRLEPLTELLRGTAAEAPWAESVALAEKMFAQSAPNRERDPELLQRAEAAGKQLEELLKAAAQTSIPPDATKEGVPTRPTTPKPASISVEVTGLVARPGKHSLREPATLLDALAAAGGWTDDGNLHARIAETDENHFIEVTHHNIRDILAGRAINPYVPNRAHIIVSEAKP